MISQFSCEKFLLDFNININHFNWNLNKNKNANRCTIQSKNFINLSVINCTNIIRNSISKMWKGAGEWGHKFYLMNTTRKSQNDQSESSEIYPTEIWRSINVETILLTNHVHIHRICTCICIEKCIYTKIYIDNIYAYVWEMMIIFHILNKISK